MAFILNSEGANVFTLSGQATQVTDMLDPALLFHADFIGGRCNRYVQNVIRTAGTQYFGFGITNPSDNRRRFETTFTVYYGKTYNKPPPVFCCFNNNYVITYNTNFDPQKIVSDFYYFNQHLIDGSSEIRWGWSGTFYTDRAEITTYEFDGDFIIYVLDV